MLVFIAFFSWRPKKSPQMDFNEVTPSFFAKQQGDLYKLQLCFSISTANPFTIKNRDATLCFRSCSLISSFYTGMKTPRHCFYMSARQPGTSIRLHSTGCWMQSFSKALGGEQVKHSERKPKVKFQVGQKLNRK